MRVHPVEACPACGSRELERFELAEDRPLQRCSRCETVSAPEYGDPADIYRDGYLFGETECGMAWELGKCWDIRHPRLQVWLRRVAERRVALIERISGGPGRLLDVGCGTGEVLLAARERGWHVQGVDPEPGASALAVERGLDVRNAHLDDAGLPERSFDVVTAFHVLEHTPRPVDFLALLARWARPGGYVVVEVPNFKSIDRRRMRGQWRGLCPLQHITHFTPRTLDRALGAAGLETVAMRSPTWADPPQRPYDALSGFGFGPTVAAVMRRGVRGRRRRPGVLSRVVGWRLVRALEMVYDRFGWGFALVGFGRVAD